MLGSLKIVVPLIFLFAFTCSFSSLKIANATEQDEPTCKALKALESENYLSKKLICIDKHTSFEMLVDSISKETVVITNNTHELNLTSEQLLELFDGKKPHLVVYGVCAGACSRLLVPLASFIEFRDDGLAVLTDSSAINKSQFTQARLGNFEQGPIKIERNFIQNSKRSYNETYAKELSQDIMLISGTYTSIDHLLWHTHVYQSLKFRPTGRCSHETLAVIMTKRYISGNITNVVGQYDIEDDKSIALLRETFGDKIVVSKTYFSDPIYGCDIE